MNGAIPASGAHYTAVGALRGKRLRTLRLHEAPRRGGKPSEILPAMRPAPEGGEASAPTP